MHQARSGQQMLPIANVFVNGTKHRIIRIHSSFAPMFADDESLKPINPSGEINPETDRSSGIRIEANITKMINTCESCV